MDFENNKFKLIEYGCVTTSSTSPLTERLKFIYTEMENIIREFKPQDMAIEELFFNKNVKTAITVAQARGVEILSGINNGLSVYEYTPLQVKQGIVGYGRADKFQVQQSVKNLLRLDHIPKPDDAADAIAIAICHCFGNKFKDLYEVR